MTDVVNDPDVQQALTQTIKAHPELLFKAAEHAVGKPRQATDLSEDGPATVVIRWQSDDH